MSGAIDRIFSFGLELFCTFTRVPRERLRTSGSAVETFSRCGRRRQSNVRCCWREGVNTSRESIAAAIGIQRLRGAIGADAAEPLQNGKIQANRSVKLQIQSDTLP